MSRRQFFVLLLIALALAASVALLLPGKTVREYASNGVFIENLDQRINEVDSLRVIPGQGGEPIHIDRNEKAWTIREMNDFPADWTRLKELLANLATAKVVEPKTSNPKYYSRLGVEDITEPGARSVLLQLGMGDELIAVLVGDSEPSGRGQYVRLVGREQSLLVDKDLDVRTKAIDWAQKEIVDIGSALVAELQITHPDGHRVVIRKISADDTDFILDDIPEGRSARSAWTVNSLANGFSMLRIEGVRPDTGELSADAIGIRLLSFSGLEILAEVLREDDSSWLRMSANALDSSEELVEAAGAINQMTGGWVFRIPDAKYDSMTKRMEDLMAAPESEASN